MKTEIRQLRSPFATKAPEKLLSVLKPGPVAYYLLETFFVLVKIFEHDYG